MISIIILSVLLVMSAYINWNLLRKTERLQDFTDNLTRWVDTLNQQLDHITTQIDVIDEKGLFKSDDYVGSMYKDISDLIKTLNKMIIKDGDENENDNDPR